MRTLCSLVAMALTSVLSANGLELVLVAYARVWAPFASSVRVAGGLQRLEPQRQCAVLQRQWLVGGWNLWTGSR